MQMLQDSFGLGEEVRRKQIQTSGRYIATKQASELKRKGKSCVVNVAAAAARHTGINEIIRPLIPGSEMSSSGLSAGPC